MGMEIPISSSVLSNTMKNIPATWKWQYLEQKGPPCSKDPFTNSQSFFSEAYILYADVFEIGAFLVKSWSGFSFINDI